MKQKLLLIMACVVGTVGLVQTGQADTVFFTHEQRVFLDASRALSAGKMERYQRYKKELAGYILYPYLEYEEARKKLTDSSKVQSFLDKYPDTLLAERLRTAWLKSLGGRKQWAQYLKVYQQDDDTTLRCYYLDAAMTQQGPKRALVKQAKTLWMTGRTRPKACNGAFKHLYTHKKIKASEYWDRLALAMNRGNSSLVRFLAKKLSKSRQRWYKQWQKMKKQPRQTLVAARQWVDTPESRDIIVDGIRRYSREDTLAAWNMWQQYFKHDNAFSRKQIDELERNLALRAAWRHLPEATDLLAQLPASAINTEVREWKVRSALRNWNWKAAQKALDAMPASERKKEEWRYWQARVFAAVGREQDARQIYEALMKETSYYGFLAAEKLGKPYRFNHEPVVASSLHGEVMALSRKPAFKRIRELFDIGRKVDANREWRFATRNLSAGDKRVAAQLASDWGWHFMAIVTTASARHFRDLDLRFPLLYRNEVEREAARQRLPISLVYGVIRRESAYRESVESPAGALGLMQLMPRTAKQVGKKLGMKKLNNALIKKADTNIRLGARYLRDVMDQYGDNVILAAASYNAGPHRVKKWLPEDESLSADIWVDTITFDETRKYVKAVLFYSTIFDWKLDNKVDHSLRNRMQPVVPQRDINVASSSRGKPG
jgi:soluble lytic murein transglycosylase